MPAPKRQKILDGRAEGSNGNASADLSYTFLDLQAMQQKFESARWELYDALYMAMAFDPTNYIALVSDALESVLPSPAYDNSSDVTQAGLAMVTVPPQPVPSVEQPGLHNCPVPWCGARIDSATDVIKEHLKDHGIPVKGKKMVPCGLLTRHGYRCRSLVSPSGLARHVANSSSHFCAARVQCGVCGAILCRSDALDRHWQKQGCLRWT